MNRRGKDGPEDEKMSNSALNIYRSGAQTFRTEAEAWKKDHDKAIECYNLEDFLATGVRIADGLASLDEKHRSRVFAGEVEFDQEMHDMLTAAYGGLRDAFESLLETVVRFENRFGCVKNADEFRSRLNEIRGILTPDNVFFGDGLIPLRDAAIDANLGGGTIECGAW